MTALNTATAISSLADIQTVFRAACRKNLAMMIFSFFNFARWQAIIRTDVDLCSVTVESFIFTLTGKIWLNVVLIRSSLFCSAINTPAA